MEQFIKKLIARLEEEKKYCSYHSHTRDEAINKAISIINELAEEYKNESCKGDLISKSAFLKVLNDYVSRAYDCGGIDDENVIEYQHTHDDKSEYIIQGFSEVCELLENVPTAYIGGWIACSERLPEVETTVFIHAKRKYRDGGFRDIITTAMYEDGTMLENDSKWRWEDIEGEWDEENDCYIIPEGWWEDKKYNEDGE